MVRYVYSADATSLQRLAITERGTHVLLVEPGRRPEATEAEADISQLLVSSVASTLTFLIES